MTKLRLTSYEREALAEMRIAELMQKAARYDWLAQGGIYRIGFDSTGSVSLDQWDSVIDELMDRESCNEHR